MIDEAFSVASVIIGDGVDSDEFWFILLEMWTELQLLLPELLP